MLWGSPTGGRPGVPLKTARNDQKNHSSPDMARSHWHSRDSHGPRHTPSTMKDTGRSRRLSPCSAESTPTAWWSQEPLYPLKGLNVESVPKAPVNWPGTGSRAVAWLGPLPLVRPAPSNGSCGGVLVPALPVISHFHLCNYFS